LIPGASDGFVVAGIGVTHHAARRVVPQTRSSRRAASGVSSDDDYHPGVPALTSLCVPKT